MRSLFSKAANSNGRRLVAALIGIAAVLLLPFSTGAVSFTELPAGHWTYEAYAQLVATGVFQPLEEEASDPMQMRTRYELALLVHKIELLLEAQTHATKTPELLSQVRVPLRIAGLARRLAVLEQVHSALQSAEQSQKSPNNDKAIAVFTSQMPALRAGVSRLQQAVPTGTQQKDLQELTLLEQQIDSLLAAMQTLRLQVETLVPSTALWEKAEPDVSDVLAEIIKANTVSVAAPEQVQQQAQAAADALAALQSELTKELATLQVDGNRLGFNQPLAGLEARTIKPWTKSAPTQISPFSSDVTGYSRLLPTSKTLQTGFGMQYLGLNAVSTGDGMGSAEPRGPNVPNVPVSIDELTQLLEKRARQGTADTQGTDRPQDALFAGSVDHDELMQHQVVGTSYQIGLLGLQVQTGLAMEKQTTQSASTVTSRISAQAPLSAAVSVNAELELVDVDRLRNLTERSGLEAQEDTDQTRFGFGGKVQWSDFGSLRIGYELVHIRNSPYLDFATSADTSVEYNISDRARLAAGFNVNSDKAGSKATTNVGVGYQVSRNSSLSASYQLINFSDVESQEYRSNLALAELTVEF